MNTGNFRRVCHHHEWGGRWVRYAGNLSISKEHTAQCSTCHTAGANI